MIKYTECKQQQVLFANEHLLKKKLLNVSDGFRNSSITFVSYRISITQRSTSIPWNVGECTWSHMDGIKIDSGETVKKNTSVLSPIIYLFSKWNSQNKYQFYICTLIPRTRRIHCVSNGTRFFIGIYFMHEK